MNEIVAPVGAGQIGLAIARRVGHGKKIFVGDLRLSNAEAAAAVMMNAGFDAIAVAVDLASRESLRAFIKRAVKPLPSGGGYKAHRAKHD